MAGKTVLSEVGHCCRYEEMVVILYLCSRTHSLQAAQLIHS